MHDLQLLGWVGRGTVAQLVEHANGPSLVQLYLAGVGSNPERDVSSHLFLITPRQKVVGKKS